MNVFVGIVCPLLWLQTKKITSPPSRRQRKGATFEPLIIRTMQPSRQKVSGNVTSTLLTGQEWCDGRRAKMAGVPSEQIGSTSRSICDLIQFEHSGEEEWLPSCQLRLVESVQPASTILRDPTIRAKWLQEKKASWSCEACTFCNSASAVCEPADRGLSHCSPRPFLLL